MVIYYGIRNIFGLQKVSEYNYHVARFLAGKYGVNPPRLSEESSEAGGETKAKHPVQ